MNRERQQQFATLLKSVRSILPVPTIEFTSDTMLQRFHHASFGLMDYLIKILDRAVWLVQSDRAEGIDQNLLATAFRDEVWAGGPLERNPFFEKFDFRPLIGLHEPFENFENFEKL